MKYRLRFINKAVLTVGVGIAFLLLGCYPKTVSESVQPPPVKKIPPDLFKAAENDYQALRYTEAVQKYQRFLEKNQKGERSRVALYRVGKFHYDNERYEEALTAFVKVAEEYPDHPEHPKREYAIAEVYFRLGDYGQSRKLAEAWMEQYPNHPMKGEAMFLMGRNFRALGNNSRAFFWWLSASRSAYGAYGIPEKRDEIHNRIIGLISTSNLDDLKEMIEVTPGKKYAPHIYHRMASIYLERSSFEDAGESAKALVRSTSEQYWVSTGRGILERIEKESPAKEGVIGCILPLSGPFAIYGQEALNGIQLGMDIFNATEGGTYIELIIKDTRGEPEYAIKGVEELAKVEKLMAIIGPLASKSAVAAARKAQELEIPIITLTQKEGITAEGEMVFRNFLIPSKEIEVLLDRAMGELSWERFGILFPDNPYGRYFMNLFWDRVEEKGGRITAVQSYKPDETDFAVEIKKMVGLHYPRPISVIRMLEEEKIRKAEEQFLLEMLVERDSEDDINPEITDSEEEEEEEPEPIRDFDAVFIPDNYQQIALITPQFPFYGIFNIPFLGTSLWQSAELVEMAGDYVQGAIFPSGFFFMSQSDDIIAFVDNYKKSFESAPGILAANGYDTIRFLKDLMNQGFMERRAEFQKRLYQHGGYYGVTGMISFNYLGEVAKDPSLLTISGRHLRTLPRPSTLQHFPHPLRLPIPFFDQSWQ